MDAAGNIVKEARVASEPEAIIAWFEDLGLEMTAIGLEAGPLSQWLYAAMIDAKLPVVLLETRQVRDAFRSMPVKTDRKDARGIAQLMRLGWYGTGPSFRRENVRVSEDFRLTLDYFERCRPNCADLRAALGVRETDKSARSIDPGSLHGLRLFPAITGQKERL